MLSYIHAYHAGNHADILKHLTLMYVLKYLNKKNKPYSFFDTHAGSGMYDLTSEESEKTGEALKGIITLLKDKDNTPEELKDYIDFVVNCLQEGFYPGSPCIEDAIACKGCALFMSELHPQAYMTLQTNMAFKSLSKEAKSLTLKNEDGWKYLTDNTPPEIKRGAFLMDPSYEDSSDYTLSSKTIKTVHHKWSAATILLWYPLLTNKIETIENMKMDIIAHVKKANNNTEILDAQLMVDTEDSHEETDLASSIGSERPRLYGSGMLVINPSWNLDNHLKATLPYLSKILGRNGMGSYKIEMI